MQGSVDLSVITIDLTYLVAFVASGGIALLIGLVMLVRFLRRYPIPAEMKTYGGN